MHCFDIDRKAPHSFAPGGDRAGCCCTARTGVTLGELRSQARVGGRVPSDSGAAPSDVRAWHMIDHPNPSHTRAPPPSPVFIVPVERLLLGPVPDLIGLSPAPGHAQDWTTCATLRKHCPATAASHGFPVASSAGEAAKEASS